MITSFINQMIENYITQNLRLIIDLHYLLKFIYDFKTKLTRKDVQNKFGFIYLSRKSVSS